MSARAKTPLALVLVNAAQMANDHPDTFHRPNEGEIKALAPGQPVKVCNGLERFWVQVQTVNFPLFVGRVANQLLFSELKLGDTIAFHADNVFDLQ